MEDDDVADRNGPKISMIVTNAQANVVDFFMDFTLTTAAGPNFYLPIGEMYFEIPARGYVSGLYSRCVHVRRIAMLQQGYPLWGSVGWRAVAM